MSGHPFVNLDAAVNDARSGVARAPEWEKGHFRRAAVLEVMGDDEGTLEAYKAALPDIRKFEIDAFIEKYKG